MAKQPNIFIATPMYGGLCHGSYAASLMRVTPIFMNAQMPFQFAYRMNESLVTRARDSLAADFMHTECTHLMFVDGDIGFAAEDILSMVGADKDIICGVYPRKEIDWERVAAAVSRGVPPEDLDRYAAVLVVDTLDGADITEADHHPLEVIRGGCGFMLVKREVLEGLADKVPEYYNGHIMCQQYFDTSIDSGNWLLSEDYHFCKLARDNSYKVWAAPWVELTHTGSYQWRGIAANKVWAAPLANAGVH
jgi:hypothetical protein